jgi:hypothetical protein
LWRVNVEDEAVGPDEDDEDSACFIKFALNNDVGLPTAPLPVAIDNGPFAALCNAAAKAGIAPSSGKNLAVS